MLVLPAAAGPGRRRRPWPVVAVAGVIAAMDPDDQDQRGRRHQVFLLRVEAVLANPAGAPLAPGEDVRVAVRYGDPAALPAPIPGLAAGRPVRVQGRHIPRRYAYPDRDGRRRAVIHFTHRPLGWVEYGGRRYE